MIFVFDIGNTNVLFGVMEEGKVLYQFRFQSETQKTTDEYAISLLYLLKHHEINLNKLKEVMVSSVVPQLTFTFVRLIRKYFHKDAFVVTTASSHGLDIKLDDPGTLGSDRLMSAFAAHTMFKKNCITVSFGTATTIEALTVAGEFLGGVIFPGVKLSAHGLHSRTAQLPEVNLAKPENVVGRNTVECIQSGLYYGYLELMDGLIDRIIREQFQSMEVIILATGGMGAGFASGSRHSIRYEPSLVLYGLYFMYERLFVKKNT
ncbi:MAG: type III pantothenate kinase [Deferribacteraceae bacterium]|jgi:type III pantothenate kinase|nr:type III pantothenate kinase [Deferribacteraceae bacterium]